MQGLLAYKDGKVVGWCNAAPRNILHALDDEPAANVEQVGTILCFLVAPDLPGQGVATRLLDAAGSHLRSLGLKWVEANPRPNATGTGESHFSLLRTDSDGSVWLRKDLSA